MAVSKAFNNWVDAITLRAGRENVSFSRFDNEKVGTKRRKRGYIAIDKFTGKTAKSYCHPNDAFVTDYGRAIAYARLRGIEIPPIETYKVKDCIGKTVKCKGRIYYISSVLAYCGIAKDYYCFNFGGGACYPTVAQLNEDTEVELIK